MLPAMIYAAFNWGSEGRSVEIDLLAQEGLKNPVLLDVDFFSEAVQKRTEADGDSLAPQSVYLGTISSASAHPLRIIESSWRVEIIGKGNILVLKLLRDSPEGFHIWSRNGSVPRM